VTTSALLRRLGIEHPIILAPMGGGPGTPELVAAVSNAGGLGSLAAGYLTPGEIDGAIRRIRVLTAKPFNVNLFTGGPAGGREIDPAPMLVLLAEIHATLGLPPPAMPEAPGDSFAAQFDAVLRARPAVFSFTFGVPPAGAMDSLRTEGIATMGTATTVEEARILVRAGVDAVVAQGAEAGGHRGTFDGAFEAAMVPTLDLVGAIAGSVRIPVIAAGGLMDGRDIAAALSRGASAVQLGTAFLACPESGASEAYKRAILAARHDTTVITRAFSGRPARGLANAMTAKLAGREGMILPYPAQNSLTRALRAAAARAGNAEYLALWAGTGVARVRAMPAGDLVRRLIDELRAAAGS
jgi:nitronate monooxygenase